MDQEQFERAAQLAGSLESIIGLAATLITLIGGLIWLRQLTGKLFPYFAILFVVLLIGVTAVILHFATRIPLSPPTTETPPEPSPEPEPEPESDTRSTIPFTKLLTTIAEDLRKPDVTSGQHRYLTLAHLHNDPSISADEIDRVRQATEDLLRSFNNIHRGGGMSLTFLPIDTHRTIYRVRVNEWGLGDPSEVWERFLTNNPYGLDFEDADDPKLKRADDQIRQFTSSFVPWYARADWFIFAVGRERDSLPESVRQINQTYPQHVINLPSAAAELGLDDASVIAQTIRSDVGLRDRMGLRPLIEQGSVTRAHWESPVNGITPFQQLAVEQLGGGAVGQLP